MLISVVMPTCNRPELAVRCLASLRAETQGFDPSEYEIIVTDDGADERTRDMIGREGFAARWVRGPRRGPAANRNNGAREAKGDWIAFIDDDCLADAAWLRTMARVAREGGVDVIEGGTTIPDKVDHPFRQGVENLRGDVYWSCNLAVRREVFQKLGGFDEDFLEAGGEDMEFGFRLRTRLAGRLRFVPEVSVYHPVRVITWKGLIWRTRLIRWMSLYYLKTGEGLPLGVSGARVVMDLVTGSIMNSLRTTWHYFRDFDRTEWKTRTFWQFWNLATLPVTLPYRLVWEFRFRRLMRERGRVRAAGTP
jgi:GT2 family glycosyltransferase